MIIKNGNVFQEDGSFCRETLYPLIIQFGRPRELLQRNFKHNRFTGNRFFIVIIRESQVQFFCLSLFHANDSILESIDHSALANHKIIIFCRTPIKFFSVYRSGKINRYRIALFYCSVIYLCSVFFKIIIDLCLYIIIRYSNR